MSLYPLSHQIMNGLNNHYELSIHIMTPEPIPNAYFINSSLQSVCLDVYPPLVPRQRFGENVTAATNAHELVEELLDA
jgi:hypothetical protein